MEDTENIGGSFEEAKEKEREKEKESFRARKKKISERLLWLIVEKGLVAVFGIIFKFIMERALVLVFAVVVTLAVGVSAKLYERWKEAGLNIGNLALVEKTEEKSFAVVEKPFKVLNRAFTGKQKINIHELIADAKKGFRKSQYQLGLLHFTGSHRLVEHDMVQAVAWWNKSAAQGYAAAQNALGFAYWRGEGVAEEDREKAAEWYKLAAEQDSSLAQYNLGVAYGTGEGVAKKDVAEAVRLWRLAAKRGLPEAQYDLAEALWEGKGVEKNEKAAKKWYEKVAEKGHPQASFRLGIIDKADKKPKNAVKHFRLAAEQGLGEAQYEMGVAYEKGEGVHQSDRDAYSWFSLATVAGYGDALQKRDDMKQRLAQVTREAADSDVYAQQQKIDKMHENKEKEQREQFLVTNQ